MGLLPGGARKRAQERLEKQLDSIAYRLDALESAPTSRSTELAIEKHVATQLEEITQELASVRGFSAGVHGQVGELEKKVADWTLAISEGIERTDRAERRIRAAIQRARKELKTLGYDDPGLEAEAAELHAVDGDRSPEHGVLTLSSGVEPPVDAASSVRGVSAAKLARARGF